MVRRRSWRAILGLTAFDYPIPSHANTFWYSLGGITFSSFVIAFITGFVLTQYYNPTLDTAYGSVQAIAGSPGLGLIRGIHYWSANVGFGLLIAHMFRIIFTGAYRTPRTINYMVGIVLLATVFFIFLAGAVLKWDQQSVETLELFRQTGDLMGVAGIFLAEEFAQSTPLLIRIYTLHIGILASLFIAIVVLHFLYIRHFGIARKSFQSPIEYKQSKKTGHTFSRHLRNLTVYGLTLLFILLGLAYFFPPGLANEPVAGAGATKPPWPFWVFVPLERAMGASGILAGAIVIVLGLALIPVVSYFAHEERRRSIAVNIIAALGLIIWITLMALTYFSPA